MSKYTVLSAAMMGKFEDFLEVYKPGDLAEWRGDDGSNLLMEAVGNTKEDRAKIANFLLDEGADATVTVQPEGYNCLHVLLARTPDKNIRMPGVPEKNAADAALLRRLLDHGANINQVDVRDGTPLQSVTVRFMRLPQEELAVALYDVLFSRPDLDLMKIGAFGESTYTSIWKVSFRLTIMLDYAQRYLRDRGIPVPDLGEPPAPKMPPTAKEQPRSDGMMVSENGKVDKSAPEPGVDLGEAHCWFDAFARIFAASPHGDEGWKNHYLRRLKPLVYEVSKAYHEPYSPPDPDELSIQTYERAKILLRELYPEDEADLMLRKIYDAAGGVVY